MLDELEYSHRSTCWDTQFALSRQLHELTLSSEVWLAGMISAHPAPISAFPW